MGLILRNTGPKEKPKLLAWHTKPTTIWCLSVSAFLTSLLLMIHPWIFHSHACSSNYIKVFIIPTHAVHNSSSKPLLKLFSCLKWPCSWGDQNMSPPPISHFGIKIILSWRQLRNSRYRKNSMLSSFLPKIRAYISLSEGVPLLSPVPGRRGRLLITRDD